MVKTSYKPHGAAKRRFARCNLIGQLELFRCLTGVSKGLVAHGARRKYMHGLVQRCHIFHSYLHISYHLAISVHSQFVFKMPSSTNCSLELLTYPPVDKDIPTELYTAGVPLIAESIFSLLNPTDLCSCLHVCTTWNYQVSSVPKFMDKVSAYRRKCKENAENHHASKKQMEVIVFPTQRQPLATFTPNTLMQIQTKETCSTTVSFKCIKPVWQKSGRVSPSKRPRQSEDISGTKKSKKRLCRL